MKLISAPGKRCRKKALNVLLTRFLAMTIIFIWIIWTVGAGSLVGSADTVDTGSSVGSADTVGTDYSVGSADTVDTGSSVGSADTVGTDYSVSLADTVGTDYSVGLADTVGTDSSVSSTDTVGTDYSVGSADCADATIADGTLPSAYGPGEEEIYKITYEEKLSIAKVVWGEARGECFEGQVAVAATVFNRFTSSDPAIQNESINSVVTQSGAYVSIANISEEQALTCMEAVEAACRGYDPTRLAFPTGARFFYAQSWISEEQLAMREGVTKLVIGNHTFHDAFKGKD